MFILHFQIINMSFDLSMRSHINTLKKKEFQRGYYMFHSFKNIWTLLTAYKSFVRPLLEYNSVIWNPKLKQDIRASKSAQKWFTKLLLERCNIKVTDYMYRLYVHARSKVFAVQEGWDWHHIGQQNCKSIYWPGLQYIFFIPKVYLQS